ncbi:MAG: zinc ABC transporter substrate-binding protein [Candidatus Omnitrophica bacterium]|nr:zinc ABC transporter substrate-binding protein [Candidatus Omnitrophota bacterium]
MARKDKNVIAILAALVSAILVFPALGAADKHCVKIVTSFYPAYIVAINVAGEVPGVSVENLTAPLAGCLHDYSLTPDDMKKLADADIFIANGAGMESFMEIAASRYPKLKIIRLTDGMPLIKNADGSLNPHTWLSVSNEIVEAGNLAKALEGMDASRAKSYRQNAEKYIFKLNVLKNKMEAGLTGYKGTKLITFHEAFPYFAGEFGLDIVGTILREPGSIPSPKELAKDIELVRRTGVKLLFVEPQYPSGAAELIAKETGAKVYTLDPAVTGPVDPNAYIVIMEKNLETLKKAVTT